jgi:hypothetical protein
MDVRLKAVTLLLECGRITSEMVGKYAFGNTPVSALTIACASRRGAIGLEQRRRNNTVEN